MSNCNEAFLRQARQAYHARLLSTILTIDADGVPSIADRSNKLSVRISRGITEMLRTEVGEKAQGQTSGNEFEKINKEFLQSAFAHLQPFRPGRWTVEQLGNHSKAGIAAFEQYAHLEALSAIAGSNKVLATAIGRDYMVCPDVIVYRDPLSDEELNATEPLVDDTYARLTMLRKTNGGKKILHASVSMKWTIRSDRSQNSRTEALNLIRNRKGPLPHIVVITAEPMPSRIASIALGTGDIDCVYHSFLNELRQSVIDNNADDARELLEMMIEGKRLKDISDLPLDLIV